MHVEAVDLWRFIESSGVCDGLADDMDVMSVAIDPTGKPDPNPTSILPHSVPKSTGAEVPHFQAFLSYSAVGCHVLTGTDIQRISSKRVCLL